MAIEKLSGKILFFTDVDETLVNTDKTLSSENLAAIDEFLAKGNLMAISTGRALQGAANMMKQFGLYGRENVLVCAYNGGQIYDTFHQTQLLRKSIPHELVYESFDLARSFGIHIQSYTDTQVVSETDNEHLRRYLKVQKLPLKLVSSIRDADLPQPVKLLCLDFNDPGRITAFRAIFEKEMKGRLDCFRSNPYLLEIVPVGVNKGSALRFLAQQENIPISNTISAGDAENDIPMIREAGIGCAMKNSEEPLKAVADYITENDNNHGGVAEILRRFCL